MAEGWRDLLGQVLAVRGSYPDWINEMQGTCAALERKNAIAVEALQAVLEETGEFWKDGEPDDARKYQHQTAADALTELGEAG